MIDSHVVLLATSTQKSVGYVVAGLLCLALVAYALINIRIGRPEVGSEIELAPNRKPYYDDETLETKVLDRSLLMALGLILAIAVALPAYWLAEPGRQEGERLHQLDQYYRRGEKVFNETAQCNSCHGPLGAGGSAAFTVTDSDGNFVDQRTWSAPALDTVLYRYSRAELENILVYGRDGTPMPPWGILGGGPLDEKAISDVITYLEYNQLPIDKVRADVSASLVEVCAPEKVDSKVYLVPIGEGDGTRELIDPKCTKEGAEFETMGEALFNLPAAGGTYSCARCHTRYWSSTSDLDEPPEDTARGADAGGSYGPSLTNGATLKYSVAEHLDFVTRGGTFPGTWEMPGFGINPNAEDTDSLMQPEQFTFTAEQIEAIVAYERSL